MRIDMVYTQEEHIMRLAVAVWGCEVSPVFDFAHRILVVQCEEDAERARYHYEVPDEPMAARAERLRELGVDVLVCGAISSPLAKMVAGLGITLIPWKCGLVDEVLAAYFSGTLEASRFSLPGSGNECAIEIKHVQTERREAP
jgi:predicted Fe-Mo cluster-binding NifX family protein